MTGGPSMRSPLEGLSDRRRRVAVCEELLIAFALVDRRTLRGIGRVPLSHAANFVLDSIEQEPAAARVALVATVKRRVRFDAAQGHAVPGRDVVRLACAAAAMSIQELAMCGEPQLIADLLRAAHAPRRLELVA